MKPADRRMAVSAKAVSIQYNNVVGDPVSAGSG